MFTLIKCSKPTNRQPIVDVNNTNNIIPTYNTKKSLKLSIIFIIFKFYFRAKKLLPTIRKKQPSFVPDMNGFRMGYCK